MQQACNQEHGSFSLYAPCNFGLIDMSSRGQLAINRLSRNRWATICCEPTGDTQLAEVAYVGERQGVEALDVRPHVHNFPQRMIFHWNSIVPTYNSQSLIDSRCNLFWQMLTICPSCWCLKATQKSFSRQLIFTRCARSMQVLYSMSGTWYKLYRSMSVH